MPDRMSNIVLFETEEEVKAYKSVLGEGYKINVEAYVRYLQEKFPKLEECSIESQSRVSVINELYSMNDRYCKRVWIINYESFCPKQIGLDLGYKNAELEIEDESMTLSERTYGMRYDPKKRRVKKWNSKGEEGEWQDISPEVINQLATEIYKEGYYSKIGSDDFDKFAIRKLCRNGVKNEICKDLKSLGVDLTPEELERLNDESEYPEGYVEAILRAEGIN